MEETGREKEGEKGREGGWREGGKEEEGWMQGLKALHYTHQYNGSLHCPVCRNMSVSCPSLLDLWTAGSPVQREGEERK